MITAPVNLTSPFTLTRLPANPIHQVSVKWDGSFIKKFVTPKWPYELYKGSLFNDFVTVMLSPLN
jgi:hypothetical protein